MWLTVCAGSKSSHSTLSDNYDSPNGHWQQHWCATLERRTGGQGGDKKRTAPGISCSGWGEAGKTKRTSGTGRNLWEFEREQDDELVYQVKHSSCRRFSQVWPSCAAWFIQPLVFRTVPLRFGIVNYSLIPRCSVKSKIFWVPGKEAMLTTLQHLLPCNICIVCTFNQCLQQQHNVDGQCRKQVVVFRATLKRIIRAIKRYCYCSQHGLPKSRANPLH